jgi:predicted unusual protein kinase regulating ubiquinone biosynthesis (AarF/ABC1/UbiB family)
MRFTDQAPWNYSDIRLEELIELCDANGIHLSYGYETPINSGMISLVYKGYSTKYDKHVVVKMKRKNIEETLDLAMYHLNACLYVLSCFPFFQQYQIAEIIHKNIDTIRHQTDFSQEVYHMKCIKENCADIQYIVIPEVYEKVTEEYPDFILMEHIDGIKLDRIHQDEYSAFAKLVIKFGIVTSVVHGITHGDLHGGNILFIHDEKDNRYPYKIGVLDFGIIYVLDNHYKSLLLDIATEMFTSPAKETAEKLLNIGLIEPKYISTVLSKKQYNHILQFTTQILEETMNVKRENKREIYKFILLFKEYISRKEIMDLGLKLSDDFIKLQFILSMSHGVTLTLCKDTFIQTMDQSIQELFPMQLLLEK